MKISSYTLTFNCDSQNFPWKESIQSHLDFSDQVVVIDDKSTDGTWEYLVEWAKREPKLLIEQPEKPTDKRLSIYSGSFMKTRGRQLSTGDFLWQFDVDEIVHELDYTKIRSLCEKLPAGIELVTLPVLEYWGSKGKCRVDVNPWKWRLSRNNPKIIHGIPGNQRAYDKDGNLYSKGSDGDDYIFSDTLTQVPFFMTYPPAGEKLRAQVMSGAVSAQQFQSFMQQYMSSYPGVHHYSWYSLKRKIISYKAYWHKHWANIFNLDASDTAKNNVFFDKPWSEVTEPDMDAMSEKLEREMGGWIFHSKVDFTKPTPSFQHHMSHPKAMQSWCEKNGK